MAEEDSEFELEGFKKQLMSLLDTFLRDELGPESKNYCGRFCKLVEEYTGRWQGPVPKLRVLQSALCSFLPAAACFPEDCEHVQCTLSSLALSVFELLLFFNQSDFLTNPLRDILDSLQECCSPLVQIQNVHLLQVRRVIGEGGPWASSALHAILAEAELPQDEVDRYLDSEMLVFLELRVRYLTANQRVSEATALSQACSQHPAAGRHPFFLQVYLTCLLKASHHDTMHQVIAEADAKDAVDVICYMEREEEDDGLVLTLCRAFLSQQLHRGDMYCLWDLVFIWSKLQLRVNPSKQALLDQCHQLMLSASNVKSIFPFMRVILAELGKEALRFCVELCTHALQSDLSCNPSTKSLIYKAIAYLLPSDLEVCRACALLVFFLERSLEAYKTVFLLYTHPDQEYHVEASPVGNHVRFEVLQVLKRGLYFDPEFWNLMALRTNCLKLMSEKVVSAALVENLEEQMWLPSYCSAKEPAVCRVALDGDLSASQLPAKPQTDHQTPAPKKRLHKDDKNHHVNPPAAKRVKTRSEKTESTGSSSVYLSAKKRGKKPGSPPSAREVGRGGASLRRSFRQLDSASQENLARQFRDRSHQHMTRLSEQKPPKRKIRKPRWLLEEEPATLAENSAPRKGKKRGRKPQQQRQQLRATGATRRPAVPGVVRNTSKQKTAVSHSARIAAGKEIQNNKRRKEFSTKNSLVDAPASLSPDPALEVSQPDNELRVCFTEDQVGKQENLPQMSPPHPAWYEDSPVFIVRPQQTTYQPHNEVVIRARDVCSFILKLHSYARRSKVKCGLPVMVDKQPSDPTMTVTPLYQRRPRCPSVEPAEKPVEFASQTQTAAWVEIPSEPQEGAVATMSVPRADESSSGGHGRLNDSSYLSTSENSIVHNTICATKVTVHKESSSSKLTEVLKETLATDITSVSNVTAYIEVGDVPNDPPASEVRDKTAKETITTEDTVVQDQPTDKDITNVPEFSLPCGNTTAPKEPTDAEDHTSPQESTATDDPDTPSLGLRTDLAKDIPGQAMVTDTDAHREPMMGELDTHSVAENKTPLLDRSASVLPIEMSTNTDDGLTVEQSSPPVAEAQSEPEAEVTIGSGPQPDSEPTTGSGPQPDSEPTTGAGLRPESEEPTTGAEPQPELQPTTGAEPQPELQPTTGAGPQPESELATGAGPEPATGAAPQPESEPTTGAGPQPESELATGAGPEPATGAAPQPESEPTTGAGAQPESEPTTGAGPQPESEPTTGAGPQPESEPTSVSGPQLESEPTTGSGPRGTAEEETPAALDQPSVGSPHDPEASLLTHRCTMCNKVFRGQRVVAHAMDHYRRDQCMFCGVLFTDNILAMMHLSEHIEQLKTKGKVVPVEEKSKRGKVTVEDEVQGNGNPETSEPQRPTQSGPRRGKRKRSTTDSSGSTPTNSRRLRSSLKLEDTQSKESIGPTVTEPCNDKQTVLRVNGHFRGRRTSIKEGEEQESSRLEETLSPEMRDDGKELSTPVRATRELRGDSALKQTPALKQTLGQTETPGSSSSAVDTTEAKTGSSSPSPSPTEYTAGAQESVRCPAEGCTWPSGLPRNNRQSLLNHALDAHYGDVKPLEVAFNLGNRNCTTCFRVCLSFQHYQDHIAIHRDTPRHPCLHRGCGARFKSGREMRRHTRKHTPLQAVCCFPGCTELFICLWALNLHEREHYGNAGPAATTAVKKTRSLKVRRRKVKERKVGKGRPGRKPKDVQPPPTGAVKIAHRLEIKNKFKRSKMTKRHSGDDNGPAGPRVTTTIKLSGRYKVRKKMKKTRVAKEPFVRTEKEDSSVSTPASDPSAATQGSGRSDLEVQVVEKPCVPSEECSSSVSASTTITPTTSRVAHRLTKEKAGVSTSKDASSLSNTTTSITTTTSSSADNVIRGLKKMLGVNPYSGGERRGHPPASLASSASGEKTARMKMTKKPLSKDQGTSSPSDPPPSSGRLKIILKPLSTDQDTSPSTDPPSTSAEVTQKLKDQDTSPARDPPSTSAEVAQKLKDQDTSPARDPPSTSAEVAQKLKDQDTSPARDPPSTSAEVTQKLEDQDTSPARDPPSTSAEVAQKLKDQDTSPARDPPSTSAEVTQKLEDQDTSSARDAPSTRAEVTQKLKDQDTSSARDPPSTSAEVAQKLKDQDTSPARDPPSTSAEVAQKLKDRDTSPARDPPSTSAEVRQKVKNEVKETETFDELINQQALEEKETLVEKDAPTAPLSSVTEATDEGKKTQVINDEQLIAHDGVTAAAPPNKTTTKLTEVLKVTDPVKKKQILKKRAIKDPAKASRKPAKKDPRKAPDPLKPSKNPAKVKSSTDRPSTSGRLKKKKILKPLSKDQGTSSSSDPSSTRAEVTQELKVKNEVNKTETVDELINQQALEEKETLVEKDAPTAPLSSVTEATDEGKKTQVINDEQLVAHDEVTTAAPPNKTTKKLTKVVKVTDPAKKKLIVKKRAIKDPLKASRKPAKKEPSKAPDPLKHSKKPAKVPVADKQTAKVAKKGESPLSTVKQESKPAVEPSDSTVTSPGYHAVFNGHSAKESPVKPPTGGTLSTGAEQKKPQPEPPSAQESLGRGKKPYIRLPPTAYLDERYTNMPKRRKEMSWSPPSSPEREPQLQLPVEDDAAAGVTSPHKQRCIRCFSSFSRPEELETHMKLKKCATFFGFDSDEEGNA